MTAVSTLLDRDEVDARLGRMRAALPAALAGCLFGLAVDHVARAERLQAAIADGTIGQLFWNTITNGERAC